MTDSLDLLFGFYPNVFHEYLDEVIVEPPARRRNESHMSYGKRVHQHFQRWMTRPQNLKNRQPLCSWHTAAQVFLNSV